MDDGSCGKEAVVTLVKTIHLPAKHKYIDERIRLIESNRKYNEKRKSVAAECKLLLSTFSDFVVEPQLNIGGLYKIWE